MIREAGQKEAETVCGGLCRDHQEEAGKTKSGQGCIRRKKQERIKIEKGMKEYEI